jgi:hypothetical protein
MSSHPSFYSTETKDRPHNSLNAFLLLSLLLLPFLPNSLFAADKSTKPKLVLQITVDALRGDLPTRYYDRLGEGGFRYLLENGIVYKDAHHAHANTETIVGHATLATGAHPSGHGMGGYGTFGSRWIWPRIRLYPFQFHGRSIPNDSLDDSRS